MCQGCVAAIRRHYPKTPKKHWHSFLFSATCFPFGTPEDVDRQLAEARAAGCTTWRQAIVYANQEMDKAMVAASKAG